MLTRLGGLIVTLIISGFAFGQAQNSWPCLAKIQSAEPGVHFAQFPEFAANETADKKVLPDISDLRGKDLNSVVVVEILIGTDGGVRCARLVEGNPDLAERSVDAARGWHFKKFLINGERPIADTRISFSYTKGNVEVLLPAVKTLRVIRK
jgi:hypothetical protein